MHILQPEICMKRFVSLNMLIFHIKLQFYFRYAIFYVLQFSDTTYKTLYENTSKNFFADILLYLDQYYVSQAYVYHISPFTLL